MFKKFYPVFSFLFFILGVLVIATSIKFFYINYLLQSDPVNTYGKVINIVTRYPYAGKGSGSIPVDFLTIEYTNKSNQRFIITDDFTQGRWKINDEIPVTYFKNNPSIASTSQEKDYYKYLFSIIFGIAIIAIGFFISRASLIKKFS